MSTYHLIDIATGRSRKETSWRNTQTTWPALRDRLATTHRTTETLAEYMSAKKSRQDEIKDIGGYVGGYLTGGRRKTANVAHRQLLTLDLDFAEPGFWDGFTVLYDNAALIYSTHKHTPTAPRLRLLMPLSREVMSDEYQAIARRVAGNLGIEQFDPTTFDPTRLMYWPSTAKDAEYIFEAQDGPWLDADAVLASYHDWRDSSAWPTSIKVDTLVHTGIKKQGDPLEKPGIVGAFCRVYTITEAIEAYLPDAYEPTTDPNRWTYTHGSTAGGLVLYDDKYAYSHHGTDPATGKLCNAFDLVRLHLYGDRDEDAKDGTTIANMPSYKAMIDLARKDKAVLKLMGQESLAAAREEFSELIADGEQVSDDWMAELTRDKKSQLTQATISNILLILNNDPILRGKFIHNAFTTKDLITGRVPWRNVTSETKYMSDVDLAGIRDYLEKVYEISNASKTADAVALMLHNNRFHPVRDYLDTLSWDGQERVETVLIDYLGAEDTPYVRAVTRKALTAAVTRVMRPGCKFDNVLVLVGPQGVGKSTLLRKLGREWYCENLTTVQGKEAAEQLHGVWIMEMGELAGLKKAEVEIIKNFISRQEDSYRPAYAVKKETYPRQCIFIGTTNNSDFLRDPSGNRRFWPVATGATEATASVFTDLTNDVVGQIWAEAVSLYEAGEPLHLPAEVEEMARMAQERHREVDDRTGQIERYLNMLLPKDWDKYDLYKRREFIQGGDLLAQGEEGRRSVSVAEIWCECLGGNHRDMNTFNTKPIHTILQSLGNWERHPVKKWVTLYGRQIIYTAKDVMEKAPF